MLPGGPTTEHLENEEPGSGVGGAGVTHHRPSITYAAAYFGVSPTFCITKTFYIISLRNKPLLGLCGMCGYYLDSGQPENSPSPAPTSVCASCFFSLGVGAGPCPSSVSLFCQDRLEATVSRGCFTPPPRGFPPELVEPIEVLYPRGQPQHRWVPFKDSQIDSQKLIKMEFRPLLVPLKMSEEPNS